MCVFVFRLRLRLFRLSEVCVDEVWVAIRRRLNPTHRLINLLIIILHVIQLAAPFGDIGGVVHLLPIGGQMVMRLRMYDLVYENSNMLEPSNRT